jgi:putative restriction endonuclease
VNSLERALLEKTGNDNGFEHVLPAGADSVRLASARHRAHVTITPLAPGFSVGITAPTTALVLAELVRHLPQLAHHDAGFTIHEHAQLAMLLCRTAELAHALPNQAAQDYQNRLGEELAQLPPGLKGTEVERLVRQRVGQDVFRSAMLDYWGGACAVTGLQLPALLRASHAKPWAKCISDAERLDVFNGFLLSANLDALFDRYLISFADSGSLLIAPDIGEEERSLLGLDKPQQLRWLAREHLPYLAFHRQYFSDLQKV